VSRDFKDQKVRLDLKVLEVCREIGDQEVPMVQMVLKVLKE
jgi:hypothetical protein